MKWPLVEVRWKDAARGTEWNTLAQMDCEPIDAVSVGRLFDETKESLTLVGTIGFQDGIPHQGCCDITIPKKLIRSRRIVEKAKK